MAGASAGNILQTIAAAPVLTDVPASRLTGQKDSSVAAKCERLRVQHLPEQANSYTHLKDSRDTLQIILQSRDRLLEDLWPPCSVPQRQTQE